MKNFKIIALILLSILLTSKIYSQGHVSVHFGPSFPVLDFGTGNLNDEDAGGADVGLNFGLQFAYPFIQSRLSFFGGIDFIYNKIQNNIETDIKNFYQSLGIENAKYKFHKYINIPFTTGLKYSYQSDDIWGVFINAGVALNFLKMTDMELRIDGRTITTEMDLANSMGFKIGAGISFNQKISIALDYLALGQPIIEGRIRTIGHSEPIDAEGKIDLLTLTLGVQF